MIYWDKPIEWSDGTPAKLAIQWTGMKVEEHRGHKLKLIELDIGPRPMGFPSGYHSRNHIYVFESSGTLPESGNIKLRIVNVSNERIVAKMNEAMEGDALWGMF